MRSFLPLVYFLVIFFMSCKDKNNGQQNQNENTELPVLAIQKKDTLLLTEYVSEIQAVRNVEIRARVHGFLENIFVDEGKEVKKGQLLFQINDLEYVTEVAKAKANVSNAVAEAKAAELEVDRIKMLVDKKVISSTEFELASAKLRAAKAKVEEANAELASAQNKLSFTSIKSPFDGVIDRIPLKIGSLIDPGALLTTISDIHDVFAYFHVSESEYLRFRKDKSNASSREEAIQLVLSDGTEYPQRGRIETMDGEINENTGAIAFRARFPNPSKLLKHGASGKIRLTSVVKDAMLIPQKSVFEIQDKNYVFVVGNDNIVKMRGFTYRNRVADFYIVEQGIQPGERIVYEGVKNIRDGMKISPRMITEANFIAYSK
ncbi:membrane fusion protein (multidrug efflux system) [Sediminibacterium goheungense]|uniref:Membrane fusion protein (Multidrug efflux system) n=1 Tax=Sediminibacterium goheungense TaxID=1086393 RepID=A0A4R6ISD5_9BACT|nr:membrane fusion protein (multidrug efflux system) [Sediminibacterium goheungense]